MCRSIHTLNHHGIHASEEEVHQAALQFVRKVSGYHHPSKANEAAFWAAVDEVSSTTTRLLGNLKQRAPLNSQGLVADIQNEKGALQRVE